MKKTKLWRVLGAALDNKVVPAMIGFLLFALGGLMALVTLIASIVAAIRYGIGPARVGQRRLR